MAGIIVKNGGKVIATGAVIVGNQGEGVIAESGGFININEAEISQNLGNAVVVDNAEVSAINALIKNNGIDEIYNELRIDKNVLTPQQLEILIDTAVEKKQSSDVSSELMSVVNNMSTFSAIATADPLILAVSAIAACGLAVLTRYQKIIKS